MAHNHIHRIEYIVNRFQLLITCTRLKFAFIIDVFLQIVYLQLQQQVKIDTDRVWILVLQYAGKMSRCGNRFRWDRIVAREPG